MSRVALLHQRFDISITIGLMQQPHRWPLLRQTSGMLPLQYALNSPQIDSAYADVALRQTPPTLLRRFYQV